MTYQSGEVTLSSWLGVGEVLKAELDPDDTAIQNNNTSSAMYKKLTILSCNTM